MYMKVYIKGEGGYSLQKALPSKWAALAGVLVPAPVYHCFYYAFLSPTATGVVIV